jgi:hypothetical protein
VTSGDQEILAALDFAATYTRMEMERAVVSVMLAAVSTEPARRAAYCGQVDLICGWPSGWAEVMLADD